MIPTVERPTKLGTVLVYGMAITSQSTARALLQRGARVLAVDDDPNDDRRRAASALGIDLVESPDDSEIRRLVRSVDLVAPAPGVPETHAVVTTALELGVPLEPPTQIIQTNSLE